MFEIKTIADSDKQFCHEVIHISNQLEAGYINENEFARMINNRILRYNRNQFKLGEARNIVKEEKTKSNKAKNQQIYYELIMAKNHKEGIEKLNKLINESPDLDIELFGIEKRNDQILVIYKATKKSVKRIGEYKHGYE